MYYYTIEYITIIIREIHYTSNQIKVKQILVNKYFEILICKIKSSVIFQKNYYI